MPFLAYENEVRDTLSNQMQGPRERQARRRDPFLLGGLGPQEAHRIGRDQQRVELLQHPDGLAAAKEGVLFLRMDFDFIEGDFFLPTGRISLAQGPRGIQGRVQKRGAQPMHLPLTGTGRVVEGGLDQPHYSPFARRPPLWVRGSEPHKPGAIRQTTQTLGFDMRRQTGQHLCAALAYGLDPILRVQAAVPHHEHAGLYRAQQPVCADALVHRHGPEGGVDGGVGATLGPIDALHLRISRLSSITPLASEVGRVLGGVWDVGEVPIEGPQPQTKQKCSWRLGGSHGTTHTSEQRPKRTGSPWIASVGQSPLPRPPALALGTEQAQAVGDLLQPSPREREGERFMPISSHTIASRLSLRSRWGQHGQVCSTSPMTSAGTPCARACSSKRCATWQSA